MYGEQSEASLKVTWTCPFSKLAKPSQEGSRGTPSQNRFIETAFGLQSKF